MSSHWIHRFSARKRWRKLIRDAIFEAQLLPLPVTPPEFATVRIERFGKKLLDVDNLYAAHKQVIDSLKDYRLITDDSAKHIELEIVGQVYKIPHTRITIIPRKP